MKKIVSLLLTLALLLSLAGCANYPQPQVLQTEPSYTETTAPAQDPTQEPETEATQPETEPTQPETKPAPKPTQPKPTQPKPTEPKPTAQAVFIMAVREPLAPWFTAGKMLLS